MEISDNQTLINIMNNEQTPKQLGYYFPAEFAPHEATWLSWPHKEATGREKFIRFIHTTANL